MLQLGVLHETRSMTCPVATSPGVCGDISVRSLSEVWRFRGGGGLLFCYHVSVVPGSLVVDRRPCVKRLVLS